MNPPGLLISVRSASEALAALEGGAALIDVKEPANGPLGHAADQAIADVVATVARQRPVSAALGELLDDRCETLPAGLSFVKWGLAGHASDLSWHRCLSARWSLGPQVVAVAYADWQCARAPSVEEVIQFAADRRGVVLIDTHCKEASGLRQHRPTLLDWAPAALICRWCEQCRAAGVRIALAGSLGMAEIAELAPARPDWFAVRGAACNGGRHGIVSATKVRDLLAVIHRCCHSATAAG